jgi:hypothetical protein
VEALEAPQHRLPTAVTVEVLVRVDQLAMEQIMVAQVLQFFATHRLEPLQLVQD